MSRIAPRSSSSSRAPSRCGTKRATLELRDVRGAGDMLGIERYNDAPHCLYSARSQSDVVIYAFPADDFEACVLKHPHAAQYVAAEGRVTTDYQRRTRDRDPTGRSCTTIVGGKPLRPASGGHDRGGRRATARHRLRRRLRLSMPAGALGAVDRETLLAWVAAGGGDAHRQSVATLMREAPAVVAPDAR